MSKFAVGIDLGTTFSCAAVFKGGKVDIIPTEMGSRTMPSIVSYTTEERLVGEPAAAIQATNAQNTVYDAKRMLGRRYDDPDIQRDMAHWPFAVEEDPASHTPLINVTFRGEKRSLPPEEISAAVLQKIKSAIELSLKDTVKDVVITVPAYFDDSQRSSTKKAAEIAGFHVIETLDEPTAAAIAYGFTSAKSDDEMNVLIFDLGGGTFDVTILQIVGDKYTVKATAGDMHLGGQDFDNKLVEYVSQKFLEKTGKDPRETPRSYVILKNECEKAKKTLSVAMKAQIIVEGLVDSENLDITIRREDFEKINKDLFDRCNIPINAALSHAGMDKNDITDLILVGGSSHIPKVRELLKNFFDKDPLAGVNADEAVAQGAAIRASMLIKKAEGDLSAHPSSGPGISLESVSSHIKRYCADDSSSDSDDSDESESIIPPRASKLSPKLRPIIASKRAPPKPIAKKDLDERPKPHPKVIAASAVVDDDDDDDDENQIILINITPLSIGIGTKGGIFQPIIKKGTQIPTESSRIFATTKDNMASIPIKIYQGERAMVSDNKLLYEFRMRDLPPRPAGHVKIEIKMSIDANNIITVTSKRIDDDGDGETKVIDTKKNVLSEFQIDKLTEEALKFEKEDKLKREIVEAKNALDTYCSIIRNMIRSKEFRRSEKYVHVDEINEELDSANDIIDEDFPKSSIEELKAYKKKVAKFFNDLDAKIGDYIYSKPKDEPKDSDDDSDESTE